MIVQHLHSGLWGHSLCHPTVIQVAPLLFEWPGFSILAFCQSPDVKRQSELFDERRRFKFVFFAYPTVHQIVRELSSCRLEY